MHSGDGAAVDDFEGLREGRLEAALIILGKDVGSRRQKPTNLIVLLVHELDDGL